MACKLCCDTGKYSGMSGRENFCACKRGFAAESEALFAAERLAQMRRAEQIAWLIRRNLERYAAKNGYQPTLQHLCGIASVALMVALRREGFSAYLVDGYVDFIYHVWLIHNRRIVDLTFTQFRPKAPRVLVAKTIECPHEQRQTYRKPLRLATSFSQMVWDRHVAKLSTIEEIRTS